MMRFAVIALTTSGLVLAQTAPPPSGGWRRATDPQPQQPVASAQDPEPMDRSDTYGQPAENEAPPDYPQGQLSRRNSPPPYGVPAELHMNSGAYVTVRLNQELSSDHNQQGDPFSATLDQPLVVDGIVVAQRGQMVYGRVAGVEKQHSDRPSKLALQLTSLTLADGTQVPVTTQLVGRQGGRTPAGVQAGTVATTTAVGAGIGAVADWGTGALVGGGIGAAAGLIGVILTRNHPTVVYPETALTFQLMNPLTISTARASQAFRYVGPEDYSHPQNAQLRPRPVVRPYGYAPAPYPVWYAPYPYNYGPAYWGPSFGIVIGRGYGWGRGYRRWR